MPDKPVETTWAARRLDPALRRVRRAVRTTGRLVRSTLRPRILHVEEVSRDQGTGQLSRGVDVVVVDIPAENPAPGRIPPQYVPGLICAETQSIPTVLEVRRADDVDHALAGVVSHLITREAELLSVVEDFAGTERTAYLPPEATGAEVTRALLRLTRVHTPKAR
ncbi:hypothetical protein [Nesterenkonia alba]|uniref:hypothetical protein n=1 Tax=Nesterenkonia alba TaxID=515814 RepID=UPI0003B5E18B|nr:hypothetical protein [Nesterenkonia alba]